MDCEVDGGENVTSKLAILLKMILKSCQQHRICDERNLANSDKFFT